MDILYCIGEGSNWNNNELRYSLRSLEKFGKNVGNIYIVGYDPGFLSDKVTFINCENKFEAKHKNILNAICYAVENSDINDEFLYSSDDHFYIKETNFDDYPYFCKGQLISKVKKFDFSYRYHYSLVSTRKLLKEFDCPTYNFSWHGNTHFSRLGIEKAKDLIKKSYDTKYGCEPTCLILNSLFKYFPFEITNRKDLKVKNVKGKEDLKNIIKNRECFSIYDKSIKNGVEEYLIENFPKKSIYEK